MAAEDHPLRATEVRTGDHGVAVADDLEVLARAERGLDAIGQGGFVRGDTGRLDELAGELQHIRTEIHGDSLPCGVHSDSRHAGR